MVAIIACTDAAHRPFSDLRSAGRLGLCWPTRQRRSNAMSQRVYKMLELTGSSPTSIEDAVQTAIAKAHETVRHIQWFQVIDTRGHVVDGKIGHWQVTVKLGFTLD
jgi:flavin-binding protein dodecin